MLLRHRRIQRVGHVPRGTRRQCRFGPQVVVQALLAGGGVRVRGLETQDRHLADRGHPRPHQLRGRHRRLALGRLGASSRDRRADAAVASLAIHVRRSHDEGRPVVDLHRAQAHARTLGQVGDTDQGALLQVLVVVAVARQRRRVFARVHGRFHDVAPDDAVRGRGPREETRGQGDGDHRRHHERGHAYTPPHVHDLARGGSHRRRRGGIRPADPDHDVGARACADYR